MVSINGVYQGLRNLDRTLGRFKTDLKVQSHSKLFTFVDFGTTANAFLSACGVKHEPSVEDLTKHLVNNSRQFYELAEDLDKYVCIHATSHPPDHVLQIHANPTTL